MQQNRKSGISLHPEQNTNKEIDKTRMELREHSEIKPTTIRYITGNKRCNTENK
jgi:hypothetical protein